MTKQYFVTGTDTDAGKTFCASAILYQAQRQGLTSLGLKPIAAGCSETDEGLRNDDALSLIAHSSEKLPYKEVNPIALRAAIAPHIAAEQEATPVSVKQLQRLLQPGLAHNAQLTLIEGAGGWLVPLNQQENLSDLAVALNLPVILVIGLKLGCINHSLLTVQALQQQGLTLAGWVGSCVEQHMPVREQNIITLKQQISAPCLGIVPHLENSKAAAEYIDISPLYPT